MTNRSIQNLLENAKVKGDKRNFYLFSKINIQMNLYIKNFSKFYFPIRNDNYVKLKILTCQIIKVLPTQN